VEAKTFYPLVILDVPAMRRLHRSPASRTRRRKGNPVPGGKTGPPCHYLSLYLWLYSPLLGLGRFSVS
jgi:hypothetical protein